MKRIALLFMILTVSNLFLCTGCKKVDTFTYDGYYSGSFSYKGEVLFDALSISGNSFKEQPSGVALNQKFPCLAEGTYKIHKNTITFTTIRFPDCSCSECLLNGEYSLIQSDKNIVFQKEIDGELQIYNLTLIED